MFRRRKLKDFSEELKSHLELEADQLREEGLSAPEAARRAHVNLGNLMKREQTFYEASRWFWLEQLRQDARYALRQLRQARVFTLTAVLTLALGIGSTTAIFTLIHAVLLKSLPVSRPEQLWMAGDAVHDGIIGGLMGDWDLFPAELYRNLRDHTDGFEELAAFQANPRRLAARRAGRPDPAQPFTAEYVSGNYFRTFGVRAYAGREIDASDDRPGAPAVAMIAYRTWQEKYVLDPSVFGSTFLMNGAAVTIVGAAPPEYFGDTLRNNPPDFWLPMSKEPEVNHEDWVNNPDLNWLYLMGRIIPGADVRTIEAQLQVEVRQWLTSRIGVLSPTAVAQIPRQTVHLKPGGAGIGTMRARYATGLELLMAISGFVLLIVCANLANLTLVRGLTRRRQRSISLALGAARGRVIRQALTESVILALIGGAAGLGIAFAGTQALVSAVFTTATYVPIDTKPDLTMLAFAFAASLITGLVFGVAPAWSANRAQPIEALRGAGRSSEHTGSLPQRTLVVLQAALSLVLLIAAGLLTRSLRNLEHQNFGFTPGGRVAVRIDPNLAGYKAPQLEALYGQLKDRLAQVPGVTAVVYALYSPMSGTSWTSDVFVDGHAPPPRENENAVHWSRVGPDYFETLGTRIIQGRSILESDTATTRAVAVVNEAFVRKFLANEEPLGKHFGIRRRFESAFEIVGIVEDAKYREPDRPTPPMYFRPRPQVTVYSDRSANALESKSLFVNDMILRFASRPEQMDQEIRRAIAAVDPNLTVIRIQTLDSQLANQFGQETLIARLTSLFGLTALLLASIGLYGVTSYSVARRAKEIGIRVALGADRRALVGMVLRNAYMLVGIGLALGIPIAAAMARLMGSRLYGIDWYNPVIFAEAAAVLAVFALIATLAPARRAAATDPVESLRGD